MRSKKKVLSHCLIMMTFENFACSKKPRDKIDMRHDLPTQKKKDYHLLKEATVQGRHAP